ncbi:hypothetical protein HMPREF3189_01146 [Clostridiales bacterium KA00134]|nr:hypothetical protein HMPREF3189_01146 [Clostridiales bacterium KA00134]
MLKIFGKLKKKKTIYENVLEWLKTKNDKTIEEVKAPGDMELEYMRKGMEKRESNDLNKALMDYYNKDKKSLDEIDEFFQDHLALEVFEKFSNFIFGQDNFSEDKLPGLSILLMRDSFQVESVKFGILLAEYYNLDNYYRALEIIKNLSVFPSFTYYGVRVLKNTEKGEELLRMIYKDGNSKTREIIEVMK